MGFNFSNINLFELTQKYQQFQKLLNACNKDPRTLLEEEMKRQNINPSELEDMIKQAKTLKKLFGGR